MKDEIKEIIESSKKIIKSNRENGFDRIIMLGDDIDKLLDYITNLQKEYQTELDENNKLSEWLVKKQKRIDKAVEIYKNRNTCKYKKERFMEDKTTSDLMYETLTGGADNEL